MRRKTKKTIALSKTPKKVVFWRYLFKMLCMILIPIFSFTLSSCIHFKRKDGPPLYRVDATKVPNAVPKPEPLSKFGNMKSYVVFGRRYYPMRSSRGFEQIGVASWYGTQFHKQRTSSGERYNMLAMTAAHKTLPLPTYLEVTNLSNQKKIIVKVNDRGPFESSRILDLSYVAAKKLGMLGRGTSKVHIRAIDPYQYQHNVMLAERKKNSFSLAPTSVYVQAGSFKDAEKANELATRIRKIMPQTVAILTPSMRSRFYRVNIGPLNDDSMLIGYITQQLKKLGLQPQQIQGS